MAKNVKSVDLAWMVSSPGRPAIENVGRFNEGYCFRLNFGVKAGIWTVCSEDSVINCNSLEHCETMGFEDQRSVTGNIWQHCQWSTSHECCLCQFHQLALCQRCGWLLGYFIRLSYCLLNWKLIFRSTRSWKMAYSARLDFLLSCLWRWISISSSSLYSRIKSQIWLCRSNIDVPRMQYECLPAHSSSRYRCRSCSKCDNQIRECVNKASSQYSFIFLLV